MGTFNVSLKTLTDRVSMEVVYTPRVLDEISVEIAEVNRPGLFLAGYYDYFDKLRLQIMGLAEMNFLSGLTAEKRYEALEQLFRQQPPAVIVCRSEELAPFPEMQELAQKHAVALLRSNETTCTLMGSLISVLNLELAPRITRHGVLVEVYGEGILILGDSGIGKSELAIELVKRGHRLVADDAVELRKVSNRQIMGTAPENIRHFIELRGIGIVNVARVYGVGAVKLSESLDLVVQLEAWDCPNHTTIGDPFYVVFAFGRRYPMRAMAKIQIMRVPFIGWILGKGGVFGVDRGHADMHAVKTALKLLKDGNKLLMFPEGTRVREGEDVAAKTGAAMFATRTGVPLVPIYIQRKKRLFARNAVVIGQPYLPQYAGRKPTPDELDAQPYRKNFAKFGVFA